MPVDDSGGKPAAGGALPAGVPDLKLEYAFTVRATLAPPDIMAKLTRGESVPARSYYFRTSAMFKAPVGSPYEWVNRTVFVSTAEREPNAAVIHFFRLL